MHGRTACALVALAVCSGALAADWGRALGSIGQSLGDSARRQIELEAEIELAKKRADIEIEKERRLQELRRQQATQPPGPVTPPAATGALTEADRQELMLVKLHPQWSRIVTSGVFQGWLSSQDQTFAKACRETDKAVVLSLCIDEFLAPPK